MHAFPRLVVAPPGRRPGQWRPGQQRRRPACVRAAAAARATPTPTPPAPLLRKWLAYAAAAGPGAYTDGSRLEALLAEKLGLPAPDLARIWTATAPLWSAADAAAGGPAAAAPHAARLTEVAAGLDALLQIMPRPEAARLVAARPEVVAAPIASWRAFLDAMGFSASQQRDMLTTAPELLVKGDIVTAGEALRCLRDLGFAEEGARRGVVAYCPQVLAMPQDEIVALVRLWSKFAVGVDERAGL